MLPSTANCTRRAALPGLLLGLSLAFSTWAQVRVTEVMPEDTRVLADEDGEHSGWVELWNSGPQPVSLEGYGLSDDPDQPFRWTLPRATLPPDGRLVVFTSGKDRSPTPALPPIPAVGSPPDHVPGLQWWVDAADAASLAVQAGRIVTWADKSGRRPADELPPPLAPEALPGKVLWLDAADDDSVEVEGGTVARWRDKSGAGNDATQGSAAMRPTPAEHNQQSVVRFDGHNDLLTFPGQVALRTVVWVGLENPTPEASLRPLLGHSVRYDYHRGDGGALLEDYPEMPGGIRHAAVFLNGVRVNPQVTALPAGLNIVIIQGTDLGQVDNLSADRLIPGRFWWGDLAEVIGFDRTLSEAEVLGLNRHLRGKWRVMAGELPPDFSASQVIPAWRPVLTNDPLTGLPAVRFDGVDDRLDFFEVKQAQTVFMVVREDEEASDAYRPFLGHVSAATFSRGGDGLMLYSGGATARLDGVPVNPLTTRPPAHRVLATFSFPQATPVDSLANDRQLDDRVWWGDVMEVAIYDRTLSPTERDAVEAHLMSKWALPDRRLHANFSIKQDGTEGIRLTAPDGAQADAVPAVVSLPNHSFGRLGNGTSWGWFRQPSPGRPNTLEAAEAGITPPPVITPPGGFFTGAREVRLTSGVGAPADARIYYTTDGSEPVAGPETVWIEDSLPPGTTTQMVGDNDWAWINSDPLPQSGSRALRSGIAEDLHQFVFNRPAEPFVTGPAGVLSAEVFLDPTNPPRTVMLQWKVAGSWDHRAFWGADLVPVGTPGTASRRRLGDLPPPGRWVRLDVPLDLVGLADAAVESLAVTLVGGRASFDALGYSRTAPSQIYSQPLVLTESTVVRVRAAAPAHLPSLATAASYLVKPAGDLPVVSLSTAPVNLFDPESGIYDPGAELDPDGTPRLPNYQRNWERPVHAEFFESDGSPGFAVDCGLKIHGAFTRNFPQRSLRLHFRRRHGPTSLDYPVFPGSAVTRFDSLMLRNAGNDWHRAYLRDGLAHSFAADIGLGHQAWRPAHVFLNGGYWGVLNLREHASDNTIVRQQDLPDDGLDIVKNEIEAVAGDLTDHLLLVNAAARAITTPANQPEVAARVNVASHLDWLAIELFADNNDWPGNNVLAWRRRVPDGQWHWMLTDCDGGFGALGSGFGNDKVFQCLAGLPLVGVSGRSMTIMRGLLAGEDYRQQLLVRFGDLLNTVLHPAHSVPRLDEMEAALADAMPGQIARWKDAPSPDPPLQSIAEWREEVAYVREFLRQRPALFRGHLRSFFKLGPDVTLNFGVNDPAMLARVRVGSLDFMAEQLPWSAPYFPGVPVPVTVTPALGYRLAGWSDGAPAAVSRLVTFTEDTALTAVLEPDPDFEPDTMVPRPHQLAAGDFMFGGWPADSPAGTYPPAMIFETTAAKDPVLTDPMTDWWTGRYDLTSRSRIKGLGNAGVSFINTSDPQTGQGYVGAALAALRTTGMKDILVDWTGGTVTANPRSYGLRLQWRTGTNGTFADVLDAPGQPVEYVRNPVSGHRQVFAGIRLPSAADDQPVVQLRWRYHALPQPDDSGARTELLLDDIRITGTVMQTTPFTLRVTMDNNRAVLFVQGAAQAACALWVSADLSEWTLVETKVTGADGRAEFENVPGDNGARFYQVRTP